MKKEDVIKLATAGVLATSLTTVAAIHDASIDHTKEVCPLTKFLNLIPNLSEYQLGEYIPTGVLLHQLKQMEKDYNQKGVSDVAISYGTITEQVNKTDTKAATTHTNYETKTTSYSCPVNYILSGSKCYKDTVVYEEVGEGLTSNWYDEDNNYIEESLLIKRMK